MADRATSYDKAHAERYLGAAIMAYHEALNAAVVELAAVKGTTDLSWFDQLHQNAVGAAKGTITEQIPIDVEAGAIRFGFETIDNAFQSLRVRIVKGD